ncbi:hypothetical protein PMAYCL1PPCAC_21373, partial [Pristionchus mayeri]
LVTISLIALSEQECCGGYDIFERAMNDYLRCRSNSPCNIFCCNCDGPCRRNKRSINQCVSDVPDSLHYFTFIDSNGDGLISEEEGWAFFMNGSSSSGVKRGNEIGGWFTLNKDGFIQPREFDKTLA